MLMSLCPSVPLRGLRFCGMPCRYTTESMARELHFYLAEGYCVIFIHDDVIASPTDDLAQRLSVCRPAMTRLDPVGMQRLFFLSATDTWSNGCRNYGGQQPCCGNAPACA
jgi:hypothetical protein